MASVITDHEVNIQASGHEAMGAARYDPDRRGYRIFVGNLNGQTSHDDLANLFSTFGPIVEVWLASNPPGFGFVVFKNGTDAEQAVQEKNCTVYLGRVIKVQHARMFNDRSGKITASTLRDESASDSPRSRSRSRSTSRSRSRSRGSRSWSRSSSRLSFFSRIYGSARAKSKGSSRSRSRSESCSHSSYMTLSATGSTSHSDCRSKSRSRSRARSRCSRQRHHRTRRRSETLQDRGHHHYRSRRRRKRRKRRSSERRSVTSTHSDTSKGSRSRSNDNRSRSRSNDKGSRSRSNEKKSNSRSKTSSSHRKSSSRPKSSSSRRVRRSSGCRHCRHCKRHSSEASSDDSRCRLSSSSMTEERKASGKARKHRRMWRRSRRSRKDSLSSSSSSSRSSSSSSSMSSPKKRASSAVDAKTPATSVHSENHQNTPCKDGTSSRSRRKSTSRREHHARKGVLHRTSPSTSCRQQDGTNAHDIPRRKDSASTDGLVDKTVFGQLDESTAWVTVSSMGSGNDTLTLNDENRDATMKDSAAISENEDEAACRAKRDPLKATSGEDFAMPEESSDRRAVNLNAINVNTDVMMQTDNRRTRSINSSSTDANKDVTMKEDGSKAKNCSVKNLNKNITMNDLSIFPTRLTTSGIADTYKEDKTDAFGGQFSRENITEDETYRTHDDNSMAAPDMTSGTEDMDVVVEDEVCDIRHIETKDDSPVSSETNSRIVKLKTYSILADENAGVKELTTTSVNEAVTTSSKSAINCVNDPGVKSSSRRVIIRKDCSNDGVSKSGRTCLNKEMVTRHDSVASGKMVNFSCANSMGNNTKSTDYYNFSLIGSKDETLHQESPIPNDNKYSKMTKSNIFNQNDDALKQKDEAVLSTAKSRAACLQKEFATREENGNSPVIKVDTVTTFSEEETATPCDKRRTKRETLSTADEIDGISEEDDDLDINLPESKSTVEIKEGRRVSDIAHPTLNSENPFKATGDSKTPFVPIPFINRTQIRFSLSCKSPVFTVETPQNADDSTKDQMFHKPDDLAEIPNTDRESSKLNTSDKSFTSSFVPVCETVARRSKPRHLSPADTLDLTDPTSEIVKSISSVGTVEQTQNESTKVDEEMPDKVKSGKPAKVTRLSSVVKPVNVLNDKATSGSKSNSHRAREHSEEDFNKIKTSKSSSYTPSEENGDPDSQVLEKSSNRRDQSRKANHHYNERELDKASRLPHRTSPNKHTNKRENGPDSSIHRRTDSRRRRNHSGPSSKEMAEELDLLSRSEKRSRSPSTSYHEKARLYSPASKDNAYNVSDRCQSDGRSRPHRPHSELHTPHMPQGRRRHSPAVDSFSSPVYGERSPAKRSPIRFFAHRNDHSPRGEYDRENSQVYSSPRDRWCRPDRTQWHEENSQGPEWSVSKYSSSAFSRSDRRLGQREPSPCRDSRKMFSTADRWRKSVEQSSSAESLKERENRHRYESKSDRKCRKSLAENRRMNRSSEEHYERWKTGGDHSASGEKTWRLSGKGRSDDPPTESARKRSRVHHDIDRTARDRRRWTAEGNGNYTDAP